MSSVLNQPSEMNDVPLEPMDISKLTQHVEEDNTKSITHSEPDDINCVSNQS